MFSQLASRLVAWAACDIELEQIKKLWYTTYSYVLLENSDFVILEKKKCANKSETGHMPPKKSINIYVC